MSTAYLVREVHRALLAELEDQIAPFGLSSGIWYFLRLMWREDGLSQSELSARLFVKQSTTVRAIDRMEAMGLVERVSNDTDKRRADIFLTEKGKELKDKALPLALSLSEPSHLGLSAEEDKMLRILLQKVIAARRSVA